jgi:hypothetical protein
MFWEQVFYLDDDEKFPSTKAKPGYWVGVCTHTGDHLTFNIVDVKTKEIVKCSNIKSARISANPTSNVFTKIHDLEPTTEVEPKDDKEPQPEPFPSVDQEEESEDDSEDEDDQSVKLAPTMASVLIPVQPSKRRTWVNKKKRCFRHKKQEPINKTVEQLQMEEDPGDDTFLNVFQDELSSTMWERTWTKLFTPKMISFGMKIWDRSRGRMRMNEERR